MSNDAITTATQNIVVAVNTLNTTAQTLNTTMQEVFPYIVSTSSSATGGAATLPANPVGFIDITLPNGTSAKVPYYA
jgi:hypothetical protein